MSIKEFQYLRKFSKAKSYSPWKPSANLLSGRRSVKNKAKAVGQILSHSKVEYQLLLS